MELDMMELVEIFAFICFVAIFHIIRKEWKDTILFTLAIFGFNTANIVIEKQIYDGRGATIGEIREVQKSLIDSIMQANERQLMDSLAVIIKERLSERQDSLRNMQDSLWVKIDSLDSCIDRHFYYVNARLTNIEKK